MKTKKTIMTIIAFVAILALTVGATEQATNFWAVAYDSAISGDQGLINLQDAETPVAILAHPDSTATYTNYTYSYSSAVTGYVASVTTAYHSTSYTPLSWDTTFWPVANSDGIAYGLAVITNPPTISVSNVVSGAVIPIPYSNLWVNVSPGSTNGWALLR